MIIGLAFILLITGMTGCGGKDSSQTQSRVAYRETEINLRQMKRVENIALDSQDRLVLYDSNGALSRFVVLDQQDREVRQIPGLIQVKDHEYNDGGVFALDRQDRLYQLQQIHVYDPANPDQIKELVKRLQIYDAGGEPDQSMELSRIAGGNSMYMQHEVSSMAADEEGRLYMLSYEGNIQVIDRTGQPLHSIGGGHYFKIALNKQGNLMALGRSGSGYFLESIDSAGNSLSKHTLDHIESRILGFGCNPHDGCLYIADSSGIKKYDAQGKFRGEILNYRSTSIFVSDVFISGLVVNAAGQIYVHVIYNGVTSASGQDFSVFKYTPDKTAARPRPQEVLTVGIAGEDPATMEKAARLYQKEHPHIEVEIKDYTSGLAGHGKDGGEDYVKRLNTEILRGKGPDIISIQGLPYQKYIDKQVLVDLNELIKQDQSFKRHEYFTNILEACEFQGKLYALPVSFLFPVMIADGAMLEKAGVIIDDHRWTWTDFHAAAVKLTQDNDHDGKPETYALPGLSQREMLDYMLASDYGSFIDPGRKEAEFDSARFVRYLQIYQDLTGLMNSQVEENSLVFSGNRSSIAFMPEGYFGGDMTLPKCAMGPRARVLAMPQGARSGHKSFEAFMLGINRNSKLQKEAWEFLKFITDTQQQATLNLYGIPINRLAQEQFFKEQSEASENGCFCFGDGQNMITVQQEPLSPAQIKRTKELIGSLNHCYNIDPEVRKIVQSEVQSFIKGDKSAPETAKTIQNKVRLYLNE